MSSLRSAFRTLNPDPALVALQNLANQSGGGGGSSGPVPQYLSNQLANYQAGLQRLTAGSGGSSGTLT